MDCHSIDQDLIPPHTHTHQNKPIMLQPRFKFNLLEFWSLARTILFWYCTNISIYVSGELEVEKGGDEGKEEDIATIYLSSEFVFQVQKYSSIILHEHKLKKITTLS